MVLTENYIDLENLYSDLSKYHMKLIAYSRQARLELKSNMGRLFDALAFSKQVEALYILKYMGCVRNTRENISVFISNENTGGSEIKPKADSNCLAVIKKFEITEEKCRHLYQCARDALESKKDFNVGNINVCSKCGYILAGDAPDECLVCRSPLGVFRTF